MKYTGFAKATCCFILFYVLFSTKEINAQTMSFSQVLTISSIEDTVPLGKVWKIESILTNQMYQYSGGSSCGSTGFTNRQIYIDGNSYYIQGEGVATGNTSIWITGNSLPFWLPEGTRLKTQCSEALLSILEFNVTP